MHTTIRVDLGQFQEPGNQSRHPTQVARIQVPEQSLGAAQVMYMHGLGLNSRTVIQDMGVLSGT